MNVLPAATTSAIPCLPDGWHLVDVNVLEGGRLALIGADADLHAAWRSDRARLTSRELYRVAAEASARVWILRDIQLSEGFQFPMRQPFPLVDQFPDGRWLVVHRRSDGEANASIHDCGGIEIRRITLGDGIEHVKIDDFQRIWVGWFDEGVFGNRDWRIPGMESAPSRFGIGAFDEHGALLDHASDVMIADCYALNAFGNEAWACPYRRFPIWRMLTNEERVWRTPDNIGGIKAIAVNHPYVLAAGGYYEDFNRALLLKLDGHGASTLGEWRLPVGARPNRAAGKIELIDGRKDELHVVYDGLWRRWRVGDFESAVCP